MSNFNKFTLGFARRNDTSKETVYRVIAKEGNQMKLSGIWYPATTYQDMETGQIRTQITEDFEVEFREFNSYQKAFTWGKDF